MKKYLEKNKEAIYFIFGIMILWRGFLFLAEILSKNIPVHPGFLGPIPWSNMDGVHYLGIAERGYVTYEQAFFPLYPVLLNLLGKLFNNFVFAGLTISYISLFLALFFLYKLVRIDYSVKNAKWTIAFLLFFFTGFFLASIYTESLFLAFLFSSVYFARKKSFILASILAGFASGTRLVGTFLLILILIESYQNRKLFVGFKSYLLNLISILLFSASGLIAYIFYLWRTYGDPLIFIHSQPAFGAGRSGGEIILLPQVVYRYFKIFLTVPIYTHDFLIAAFEFLTFFLFLGVLLYFWKKIRLSYLVFSALAIIVPTLSGTLSSEPRYLLAVFPVFMIFSNVQSHRLKTFTLFLFIILLLILTAFFLRGYFIA